MSIYHDKIELVDYTFIRYRAVFVNVHDFCQLKYIARVEEKNLLLQSKVSYTQRYSLNGRER
jgi:hypothetical protein